MTETMELPNTAPLNLWTETCTRCGRRGEIGLGIWMDADTHPVCADGCAADQKPADAAR